MVETSKQDRMPYLLFLCENRILAQNIDGHVIDLGGLTKQNGTIDWLLDSNKEKGENLKTEIEALEDIANKIDFLFLDSQFTSLPDISAEYKDKLTSAPSMEIVLNELGDKP
ncbi:hypothetical protein ACCR86_09450 [Klebsiella pneumoniae]|nr:hypothetical protein [Klebsiella pneumoniae]HBS1174732.1 hypothetical protein [Klebsiella pneumoniae]